MTADEMVAEATRRAREANPGREHLPKRGPFTMMALNAGIDEAVVRRAVGIIGGTIAPEDDPSGFSGGFGLMMNQESRDRFLAESARVFAERGLRT